MSLLDQKKLIGHEMNMLIPEFKSALQNGVLGKYLDIDELEMLLAHSDIVDFHKGENILTQGKSCFGIYIIIAGTVSVTAKLLGDGTTQLEILGPGNFLGEVSFIEKIPSATSIIANDQVSCLLITDTYLKLLSAYFPHTKYKLFLAISVQVCTRLKVMHDKIIHFIENSDMTTQSLFGEIIQSLTKPTEIKDEEMFSQTKKLLQLPLFKYLSAEESEELLKHTVLLKAPKHCTLIRKDEKNASCYIVLHGAVQSSIIHENKVAKLSVIGPGTLFAGIACIDSNTTFTITFATCELAVLLRISETELRFFQNERPLLWYKIFDLICRSIIALERSVEKLDIRLHIEIYNR